MTLLQTLYFWHRAHLAKIAVPSSSLQGVVTFNTDSHNVIVGTGATAAFSPSLQDFTEFMPMDSAVQGLGTLKIKGIGTIEYKILTDKNIFTTLTIRGAYYVPSLGTQLLSPQQICQQYKSTYEGGSNFFKLRWSNHCKTIQLTKANNLPILYTALGNTVAQTVHAHVASSATNKPLAFKVKKRIPEYNLQPDIESEQLDEELMATTDFALESSKTPSKKHYRVQCTNKTCSDCNKITINTSRGCAASFFCNR